MAEEKQAKTIQSVHRALDLLECIADSGYGYRLGEVAARCGLNKTTAFHLLKTLESRGYIEQSYDTQYYKVGWKTLETFGDVYKKMDSPAIAMPYMERICARLDETVSLYYYVKMGERYKGICLAQLESEQPLRYTSRVGARIPLHCTAAGKVRFLGYSSQMLAEQLELLDFEAHTPATVTDKQTLAEQLEVIRRQGYCIEREEYQPGICSVAVPLFKYTGRVTYALAVEVPAARADEERLSQIAAVMMEELSGAVTHPDFLFKGAPLK